MTTHTSHTAAPHRDRSDGPDRRSCLVTGATGYVGGRLVPHLLRSGHTVRAMARDVDDLMGRSWLPRVQTVTADLSDPASLRAAFEGVEVLYYLVHSMGSVVDFTSEEADTAGHAVDAARAAGVGRIVYLGGLHPSVASSSEHLDSRTAVGDVLMDSGIPTVAFQAGIVIGAGSASFEMIRRLTDALRVVPVPRWVRHDVQPIAIADVLHYLTAAATAQITGSRTYDIGGPDVLGYRGIIEQYAHAAGLPDRRLLAIPGLPPVVVGWAIAQITSLPRGLVTPLVQSLRADAVASEHDVDDLIERPQGGLTTYRAAVVEALDTGPHAQGEGEHPAHLLTTDPPWAGPRGD